MTSAPKPTPRPERRATAEKRIAETARPDLPKPAPKPAAVISDGRSPAYRRAVRDRGGDTRARLVAAAVDVFGRFGFEGARTRQIAREAGANLAAIVYHFGSKEALYLAVADHIVEQVGARLGAAMPQPDPTADPAAARAMLSRMIESYAEMILGEAEAERWARFIVREQMEPTAAFDVLYRFMGGSLGLAARLVGTILGRDPDDEEVRLRVFTIMGQIMVFRVAQALVLRRMGWTAIGQPERDAIKRAVVANIDAIFPLEGAP